MKTRTLSISISSVRIKPGALNNLGSKYKSLYNMDCGGLRSLTGAQKGKKAWE